MSESYAAKAERERIIHLAEKQIANLFGIGFYFEADALKVFIESIRKG